MDLRDRLQEAWSRSNSRSTPADSEEHDSPGDDSQARLRRALQRAWSVQTAKPDETAQMPVLPTASRHSPEQVLGTARVHNHAGQTMVREWHFPLHHAHGRSQLESYVNLVSEPLPSHDNPFASVAVDDKVWAALTSTVFFDTETTGLAGGTGTYIILAGLGYFSDQEFVIQQFFLEDYDYEPALLAAVQSAMKPHGSLVTFNGRSFDVPLLTTRFTLAGTPVPAALEAHWDLLHSARRIYGLQLESCSLSSLESAVLGVQRTEDLPGYEIPTRYFMYLRNQDASYLAGLVEHNRDDLLSLVTLAARLLELAVSPIRQADTPHDLVGLGRAFELEGALDRAVTLYNAGLTQLSRRSEDDTDTQWVRVRLARALKRLGRYREASHYWSELTRRQETAYEAYVELAKYYEHRSVDLDAALATVDQALQLHLAPNQRAELIHRRSRLLRKLRQAAAE